MLKWLVMALVAAMMIAEGWVFFQAAHWTGILWGLVWIAVSFLLGMVLLRIEGTSLLFEVHSQLQNGVVPTRELLGGALILLGAVLLMLPGYLTDAFGVLVLLRPIRRYVARRILRWLSPENQGRSRGWESGTQAPRPPSEEVIEVQPSRSD